MPNHAFPTLEDRRLAGLALRKQVARQDLGVWKTATRDPIESVLASNEGRLPDLVPIKMGRMSVSPFAFFRGSAPLMAADLAQTPVTGMHVQICGDAHVRNLGAYAAPDGHLVFDLNDFDETTVGPWEWDLKRLAASVVLCGRETDESDDACADAVITLARSYREWLGRLAEMRAIDIAKFEIRRYYSAGIIRQVLNKAKRVTPLKTLVKLTGPGPDGTPVFRHEPPGLHHVDAETRSKVLASLQLYRGTVSAGRRAVFDAYHPADVAFKVVGTGSVGTRDYVVLLFGNGTEDPMFLQVKEALPSSFAPYLKKVKQPKHNGQRVAEGQQRMQTVTDPFIGWTTLDGRDFLVRQLADRKASIEPADLAGRRMLEYATVCGETLAKAHARTGDPVALAAYCGTNTKLDKAITKFALAYADQVAKDHRAFTRAIRTGRIKAKKGV